MSLYDVFYPNQFIIVPFSAPPASDSWDFWFILKTFGPGIVTAIFTGTIAILAYRIARTQREIAANKYDLDLFDKRYEIFENFIPCYDKINKLDIKEYDDNIIKQFDNDQIDFNKFFKHQTKQIFLIKDFIDNDLLLIINKLEKASRIFGNITKDNVKKFKNTIYDFQKEKNKFILRFIISDNTTYNEVENKIYPLYERGHDSFYNDKIKKHEEDILAHKKKIEKLNADINSFSDEATKIYIEKNISEHNNSILSINRIIKTTQSSFSRHKEDLEKYNFELKYLIETIYSLKTEFLKMYNIMDTYLSIKEDAYKK